MKNIRALPALIAVLAALATGCADITTKEIDARDTIFMGSARIAVDISPQVDGPATPHTGHAIELGGTGGKGEDRQQLVAGDQPVIFGNTTFNSPNDLNHEFRFAYGEFAYRYRHFFGGDTGTFGIEGLAGLGYAGLELTVTSALQRASEKLENGGVVLGGGVIWKFLPRTSVQTRIMVFSSGDREGVSNASRFDLFLAQAIGRHAGIRVGYSAMQMRSWREYDDSDDQVRKSPIRVRAGGPAAALELMF